MHYAALLLYSLWLRWRLPWRLVPMDATSIRQELHNKCVLNMLSPVKCRENMDTGFCLQPQMLYLDPQGPLNYACVNIQLDLAFGNLCYEYLVSSRLCCTLKRY